MATSTIDANDIRRLRVAQYHTMIDVGILTEDDAVELINGWLVNKMPKNPKHRLVTQLTREALAKAISSNWYVDAQEPITTTDSEPEPDVVIVRGKRRQYADRHPGPKDLALVVEVADTSLQRDRTTKKQLYARVAIPEFWIINLLEYQLEKYTDPLPDANPPDYRQCQVYQSEDRVEFALDDQIARIEVREIFP